ncbi:Uncharacterised protein [Mycobacteroides abscessus subsp. abscessus]|nr:Uncharacterised protein [Mycobacteroides abscessus subsp. abscessus]
MNDGSRTTTVWKAPAGASIDSHQCCRWTSAASAATSAQDSLL